MCLDRQSEHADYVIQLAGDELIRNKRPGLHKVFSEEELFKKVSMLFGEGADTFTCSIWGKLVPLFFLVTFPPQREIALFENNGLTMGEQCDAIQNLIDLTRSIQNFAICAFHSKPEWDLPY